MTVAQGRVVNAENVFSQQQLQRHIEAAIEGDVQSYQHIYHQHVKQVYALSLRLTGDAALSMTSVNGSSRVSLSLAEGGEVNVDSVGGRIELDFQQDVSARFEIEAHAGGKIINNVNDEEVKKSKYGPGRWLDFSTGSGEGKVRVSTVNGRVTVSK